MVARILVLCRANVARSPLLAARLRLEIAARQLDGAVEVGSAGVDTLIGLPMAPGSRVVAERWGLDLDDHRSTPLVQADAGAQDLVLTMERAQTQVVTSAVPYLAGRIFTASELAHVIADPHVAERLPCGRPEDRIAAVERIKWVVELADGHRPGWWRHRRGALEVTDPARQGQGAYDHLGERCVELAARIALGLFGPGPETAAGRTRP